jgi:hypothetical protein
MVSAMEIVRAPEIRPDRDGGKRWPSPRRRGARPPRPTPASDAAEIGSDAASDDAPTAEDARPAPPAQEPPHRIDVTA